MEWSISLKYAIQSYNHVPTECTKSYRKSVLHLLKYTANLYLNKCSKFWDTQ